MIRREDLANYKLIESAIKSCERRIVELESEEKPIITDKVRGSNTESPYEMRSYMIVGCDPSWIHSYRQRRVTEEKELMRLKRLKWDIEEMVIGISNLKHRAVIEKTMSGKSQETIAWQMGMTQANVSHILKKYTSDL